MNTESIGAYSPTTVYGQLTSPFVPRNITLNAHTPYDKESDTDNAVQLSNLLDSRPKTKLVSQDWQKDVKGVGYANNLYKLDKSNDEEDKFPPEYNSVTSFSMSSLSSKDIVKNAMKNGGYTAEQAVVINKARKAYANGAVMTKNPVRSLINRDYRVA